MRPLIALVLLIAVVLVASEPVSAQVPEGAVARVGDELILKSEFDAWWRVGARGGGPVVDPPRFERCIAAERRRASRGKPKPSRREARRRCERRARVLQAEVMQFLVQSVWIRQEAAALGIEVSLARVLRSFERQKGVVFVNEREYREFLRASGMSQAQLLFRTGLDLLQTRLTQRAAAAAPPVTDEDVKRYYAKHRRESRGVPRARALRKIRALLTANRQQRAVERFTKEFRARYTAITECAEGYDVGECGAATGDPRASPNGLPSESLQTAQASPG